MYPYEAFFHSDNYSHTYHVLLNSPIFFPDHSMHLKERKFNDPLIVQLSMLVKIIGPYSLIS